MKGLKCPVDVNEEFKRAWEMYRSGLRHYCAMKLNNYPDEVDDVVSEVFYALWESFSKGNIPDNIKAWMYAVATNKINNKYKEIYSQRERTIPLTDSKYNLGYAPKFISDIENTELSEELFKEIESALSEEEKLIITLFNDEGMSLENIAKKLGSSYSAVKQKRYRARKKMRKIYKNYEFD